MFSTSRGGVADHDSILLITKLLSAREVITIHCCRVCSVCRVGYPYSVVESRLVLLFFCCLFPLDDGTCVFAHRRCTDAPASFLFVTNKVLRLTGTKRMVVGHTPQRAGINSAADGQVWRVDTGMTALIGGRPEVSMCTHALSAKWR